MIKGKRINNDTPTLGLVCISAPEALLNPDIYKKGKSELESRGVKIIEGDTLDTNYYYLAEKPRRIADSLLSMFQNPEVDAIMCVGGGTCMNKLLPYINFNLIGKNYKPFIGISDITALLLAMVNHGIISFHGPFALWSYGIDGTPTDFTHSNWLNMLKGNTGYFPSVSEWSVFRQGTAEGKAIGGNISTIVKVAGTKYCPVNAFSDSILFLEDIGEDFDSLDSKLTFLKLLGVFDKIKGVVIGKLVDCNPPENIIMQITDFFNMVFDGYDFPVIYDCDFGHIPNNLCIPLGCRIKIKAHDKPSIYLLEEGVI
jgi:muramoyltetrapeptide carboxypeptidase